MSPLTLKLKLISFALQNKQNNNNKKKKKNNNKKTTIIQKQEVSPFSN